MRTPIGCTLAATSSFSCLSYSHRWLQSGTAQGVHNFLHRRDLAQAHSLDDSAVLVFRIGVSRQSFESSSSVEPSSRVFTKISDAFPPAFPTRRRCGIQVWTETGCRACWTHTRRTSRYASSCFHFLKTTVNILMENLRKI